MIDHEISETFPPHFLSESGPSAFGWAWGSEAPGAVMAEMTIATPGQLLGVLTLTPGPNGSFLTANEAGLFVHLSEADKAPLKGREVLFGVCIEAEGMRESRFGQIVVSDWAAVPSEGRA